MSQLPPVPDTKSPPVRRRTPLVFIGMILLSLSIVLGFVLLSRDMQNLRRLAAVMGWQIPPAIQERTAIPAPRPPAVRPSPPRDVRISSRLFLPRDPAMTTAFRRTWQVSGRDMCRQLRDAGIGVTEWGPAALSPQTFECSYERIDRKQRELVTRSIFLIVRGNAEGTITGMRVKLVDPPRDGTGRLDPQVLKIFEVMLSQSRWGDFAGELEAIASLKDVHKDEFGASMTFSREFDNATRYNFVLTLRALTPEQKRSNPYFNAESGFRLPQPPPVVQDPAMAAPDMAPPPTEEAPAPPTDPAGEEAVPAMPDEAPADPLTGRQDGVRDRSPVTGGEPVITPPMEDGETPAFRRERKRPGVRDEDPGRYR